MQVFLTYDYELFFGTNPGTVQNCMLAPTQLLMDLAARHKVLLNFFVDAGHLLSLKRLSPQKPKLQKEYDLIRAQLEQMQGAGHNMQLHIHPHWEDAHHNGSNWVFNTNRFKLDDFSQEQVLQIVTQYAQALQENVADEVIAYRAGAWLIQPFDKIGPALKKNNIWIDSTIFSGGISQLSQRFYNFSQSPKEETWQFESNPIVAQENGYFLELPISHVEYSPVYYWQMAYYRLFGGREHQKSGNGTSLPADLGFYFKKLFGRSRGVVNTDEFKSSYLLKAFKLYEAQKRNLFVTIGHPKNLTPYSVKKLDSFLKYAAPNHEFATYRHYARQFQKVSNN